jgi:hypothetical protein
MRFTSETSHAGIWESKVKEFCVFIFSFRWLGVSLAVVCRVLGGEDLQPLSWARL